MTFPADTFEEAVDLSITASNQLHTILNGDSTTEVAVEDGSKIPSVRKAMVDSLYFKPPIAWAQGAYEDTYNQLREFVDGDVRTWWFAKGATVSTPVLMTTNPAIDVNWTLWSAVTLNAATYETQKRLAAEAGLNMVGSFLLGATVTTTDDVVFYETDGKYYGWGGALPKVVPADSTPETSGGIGAGAWVDRTDNRLRSDLNVVVKTFSSVADMVADATLTVGQIVETLGYYNGWAGTASKPSGGNRYEIVASSTGTEDGGSFITLNNGLQAKGLFIDGHDISMWGAVAGSTSYKAINAIAIGNCLSVFKEAVIPIGRYYTAPISSSIVNAITRPVFKGQGCSNVNSSSNASIIDTDNGDFYYGGAGSDYLYTATNLVFNGGSSFTARMFGTDAASASPYEHRVYFENVGFYACLKAHYCDWYSSSSYLNNVTFSACKYGFYPVKTCSNTKASKINLISCGTGLRAWGYGIQLENIHIGFGIQSGSGFGHARGLDLAGKVYVNTMYSEDYGGDTSDCVLMRLAVYDPGRCCITLNNCEFQPTLLPNDVECSMEYNNGVYSWPKDWLVINSIGSPSGSIPTPKLCASDSGYSNTRLLKGIKINGWDGLNYTSSSTTKIAYFNSTDLVVNISGSNALTYANQTSNNISANCLLLSDISQIRYATNMLNYTDPVDRIYSGGYLAYGDKGWYSLKGEIHMVTALAVGSKYAIACRYRNKDNAYISRIIATGIVLAGNIIDCTFDFQHEANGGASCLFGFVTSPADYSSPVITDVNASTTTMMFRLRRLEGSMNTQA